MKREIWPVMVAVGAFTMLAAYQNCSTSTSDQSAYYSSTATATECDSTIQLCDSSYGDPSTLYLSLTAPASPIKRSDVVYTIGGECSGYGFPIIKVKWSFANVYDQVVSQGTVGCDGSGRFSFQIPIPLGFNYTLSYKVTAEAVGQATSSSPEVSHPTGGARKTATISADPS